MAKVTIQSIAKDLGLSRNTVSMALKGNDLVAQRTREMVLRYAQQRGYVASSGEEGERQPPEREEAGDHRIMILRKPDVAVYWDKVINGISEEASRNHCQTQVAVVTQEDEDVLRLPPGLEDGIEAVFCVKMMNIDYISVIERRGIQIFLLDTYKDVDGEMPGDVVKIDSFRPVVKLVRHLIDQGMGRIGFLNESSSIYETMHDRFDGYLYAMRQAGIEPVPELVMPDAVVCGNYEIAKFLTQTLRGRGIRVPEDVAVTGFDNDEEGMLDPFFTTVNVDAKWLGKRMVQCFLWRLGHPEAPFEKIDVIIRKSSVKRVLD